MKNILLLLTLNFSVAYGAVIEKNEIDKKIYIHPTPTLQIEILDLETEGGLLSIFLDYESENSKKELSEAKSKYPDYEIQSVTAVPVDDSIEIEITDLGLKEKFIIRQGQIGAYLNSQIMLTTAQMKKVTEVSENLSSSVKANIRLKSFVNSVVVKESYKVDRNICRSLDVNNVGDLIVALNNLKKPTEIKYPETFEALKSTLLKGCFSVVASSVSTFEQLLSLPLALNSRFDDLTVKFEVITPQNKVYVMKPLVKLNFKN
jgi:hypothetical protein